jgi:integrase/recombinase XerC
MMTDKELISAYDADMAFRNLLDGTRHVRGRYLSKFAMEVGFYNATEARVILWLGRPLSPKTRGMWLSTLNAFYVWAAKNRVFPKNEHGEDFNPVRDISKPRQHARHPRPMPGDEVRKAIDNATPEMKCWLLLAALAGCRCQEIAGVSREDVDEVHMRLHIVHGKGDKERWAPLHPDILAALRALPMRSEGNLWDETASSVSRKGNKYLHALGIKSTMHTLRHYFGTEVYRASKDLRLTQELMGHSSPQTTAVYAAADQTQASGIVGQLHI